jgi:methyl-accepting chemotaxis protein
VNILISNIYLVNSAGSELYTKDLAAFLVGQGHSVTVFSPALGPVAEEIKKIKGVKVINNLDLIKDEKFDILHVHHNVNAYIVREYFPDVPAVMVIHGVLPEYEQPPRMDLGISKYIAVSEEVQRHLQSEYDISPKRIEVVYNWVNTDRFYPRHKISNSPERMLVLSNHLEEWQEDIYKEVCESRNIDFLHVGLPENPVQNVEEYINESDVVVTLGRGAMESMACERNVIISDIHGVDGMLTPQLYEESIQNNLSGRRYHKKLTKDLFEEELNKYSVSNAEKMREIADKNHNRERNISKILSIYEEVMGHKVSIDSDYKKVALEIKVLARESGLQGVRAFDLEQQKEVLEGQLDKQAGQLEEQIRQLDKQAEQLNEQARQLEEQTRQLGKQAEQLDEQARQLEEQTRQLDKQAGQLEEQTRQLDKQAEQLDEQASVIRQLSEDNRELKKALAVYQDSKIVSMAEKYWQVKDKIRNLIKKDS